MGYNTIANVLPFLLHDCDRMTLIKEFVILAEKRTIANVFLD